MKIEFKNIKGLLPVEKVVLSNVINMHNMIEDLKEKVLEYVANGEFEKASESLKEANYSKWNPCFLTEMKKQVMEYCEVETLLKIVNNQPFQLEHSWNNESYTIPKCILPKGNSFGNISASNPKAAVFKAIGATVVM